MKLEHQFTMSLPPDEAWRLFTDVERIAPSMPGAELLGVEGDSYRGRVKVKVGPVVAHYEGKASFVEKDPAGRRAVLRAEGRDTRGQGNAKATVTAALTPVPGGTRVDVATDLAITGRLAQIGRGLLADVSGKLLDEFVANLERDLASKAPAAEAPPAASRVPTPVAAAPASATSAGPAPTTARPAPSQVKPVDLVAVAGGPVLKRFAPLLIVIALAALAWIVLR